MSKFFSKVIDRIDKLDVEGLRRQFKKLVDDVSFFESVFNTVSEGILVVNAQGMLVYTNAAAERLTSAPIGKVRSKPVRELLPGWDWDNLLFPSSEGDGWSRKASSEIEVLYPERRILEVSSMPNGELVVVIVRDVTAAHAHEADMMENERTNAVQDLAAGLAHEIGNPLNALSINLQLLEREFRHEPDPTRRTRLLADIATAQEEINRIADINREFLEAMRPIRPNLVPGSIVDPISNTLAALRPQLENRRIHTTLSISHTPPAVALDVQQMQQVFFNLVKNALEAMKDGGAITINIDESDDAVSVSFRDTGAGMDAASLAALFEPYRTTKKTGTGLGLMLSRRIVRAHGGEIDVESKSGAGTKFTVRLPRLEKRVRRLAQNPQGA